MWFQKKIDVFNKEKGGNQELLAKLFEIRIQDRTENTSKGILITWGHPLLRSSAITACLQNVLEAVRVRVVER